MIKEINAECHACGNNVFNEFMSEWDAPDDDDPDQSPHYRDTPIQKADVYTLTPILHYGEKFPTVADDELEEIIDNNVINVPARAVIDDMQYACFCGECADNYFATRLGKMIHFNRCSHCSVKIGSDEPYFALTLLSTVEEECSAHILVVKENAPLGKGSPDAYLCLACAENLIDREDILDPFHYVYVLAEVNGYVEEEI